MSTSRAEDVHYYRLINTTTMTALTSAGNGLMMLFVMGWGLIIGMSLVISFMKFIFSCVEDRYNGVPRRNRRVERGECYKSMSPERQKEIDDLRKNALQRYLSKFTLVRYYMSLSY